MASTDAGVQPAIGAPPQRTCTVRAEGVGFLAGRQCSVKIVARDTAQTVTGRLRRGLRLPQGLEDEMIIREDDGGPNQGDIDVAILLDAALHHINGQVGDPACIMAVVVDTTVEPVQQPWQQARPTATRDASAAPSARSAPADSAAPSTHYGSDSAEGSKGKRAKQAPTPDWATAMNNEWPKHVPRCGRPSHPPARHTHTPLLLPH